jgi:hypothetical protein
MIFLNKLDRGRYGSMMTDLSNAAMRGTPWPSTLAEAYTVAAHWQVSSPLLGINSRADMNTMQSVYMFADDIVAADMRGQVVRREFQRARPMSV